VTPTITPHTMVNPMLSRVLNIPERRNQRSAAVQTAIQTTPYQGLLILFIISLLTYLMCDKAANSPSLSGQSQPFRDERPASS
jgi:hypothetical protein